jgi:hypothetical protein
VGPAGEILITFMLRIEGIALECDLVHVVLEMAMMIHTKNDGLCILALPPFLQLQVTLRCFMCIEVVGEVFLLQGCDGEIAIGYPIDNVIMILEKDAFLVFLPRTTEDYPGIAYVGI